MKTGSIIIFLILILSGCSTKSPVVIDGTKSVYPIFIENNSKIEEIYASSRLFEAPVWDAINKKLYFTGYEKGSEMLMRFVDIGKADDVNLSKGTGGTFISLDPRYLLTTNGETHQIIRFELFADHLDNPKILAADEKWFQPNDLCQTSKGEIYFTDPDFKNKKNSAVYHLSSKGIVTKVIFDLPVPNGIIASNDGTKLYVSDSQLKVWRVFKILKGGLLDKGEIFFNPLTANKNNPDGMTIDEKGNVYCTGLGGIWIVSPIGKAIGFIPIPEMCTNIAFGGEDYTTLYITCYKKVYRLATKMKGFIPKEHKLLIKK